MALLSSISFELEIATLQPKNPQGIPVNEIPDEVIMNRDQPPVGAAAFRHIPLGIRWRVKPELGLPRQPFYLWRRAKNLGDPVDKNYKPSEVANFFQGQGIYSVDGSPFYILLINIQNTDINNALRVEALNMDGEPIPGQIVLVPKNTSATIRFQHPFISGFVAKGSFTIKLVSGVTMNNFIDRPSEWELIQVVGLPAKETEVTGYDPQKQGYASQLGDPIVNGAVRLRVAQKFYQPLPTLLPSGLQVPVWEIPDDTEAIDELRKGEPPLLDRIGSMFKSVDEGQVFQQSDFRVIETVPGIHQPEFPSQSTPDATLNLPLLATFLINAITDPWLALASGFGTTDFPFVGFKLDRTLEPFSYFQVSHDYMVTSSFTFRFTGEVFTDPTYKEEYCALSHKSILPTIPPTGLECSIFSLNRPPERDAQWSAEVALIWNKFNHLQLQGNAVAVSENGGNAFYLNSLRPASVAHQPALYVPMKPGEFGDPQLATKNRFIDAQTALPFKNTTVNKYGVASMDPFGRWSDWKETQLNLDARPPESPRLVALNLIPDKNSISGNVCPHDIVIEVIWDWQDRSPKLLQLAGVFHKRIYLPDGTKDNGYIPPTIYPSIFQTDNTITTGSLMSISFASDSPAGTAPGFNSVPTSSDALVTIELLPQEVNQNGQIVDGEMRRYRITRKDVRMVFNPDEEWFFTCFVKAAEWRNDTLFSDTVLPIAPGRPPKLTSYVPNPIPAPPPVFVPPTIIWAPLPDARGISRFRLSFDNIPSATGGYAVFRAFESKLRDIADLPVPEDTNLITRATDLRDIAMLNVKCLDAFTRLNTTLIPPVASEMKVEYEVELAGTMDGLAAFAVSSVTREQETSAMSLPWLFVAIPKRDVPAPPILFLKQQNGTNTITCEFAKAPKPSLVEFYRSQKEVIARDADLMGIPVAATIEAQWQSFDEGNNPVTNPAQLHHFNTVFNDVSVPSWFPYYYRARSIGNTDAVAGFIAGRSPQSNLVKVEKLPALLPVIKEEKAVQSGSVAVLLSFKSDAILDVTPHGTYRVQILAWDYALKQFSSQPVVDMFLNKSIPIVSIPDKNQVYHSVPDADGLREFQLLLDVTGTDFLFKIRISDPLSRTTEKMISGTITTSSFNPNLSNATASRSGKDLLIFFESTSPFIPPLFGNFMLEINAVAQRGRGGLLMRIALSQIPPGPLAKLPQALETMIIRDAAAHPPAPVKYGAIFKNFYTGLSFPPMRHVIRIRLTAPDNTSVVVTVQG